MAQPTSESQACAQFLALVHLHTPAMDVRELFQRVHVKTYSMPVVPGDCWYVSRMDTPVAPGALVTLWWAGLRWDVPHGFWTGFVGQIGELVEVYNDQVVCRLNTGLNAPSFIAIPHAFFTPPERGWQGFSYRVRRVCSRRLLYAVPEDPITVDDF